MGKRTFIEEMTSEVKTATERRNVMRLYEIIIELSAKKNRKKIIILGHPGQVKNGAVIICQRALKEEWAEGLIWQLGERGARLVEKEQ